MLADAVLVPANVTSFYVLVNGFIVRQNGLSEEEAALGITIAGKYFSSC